MAARVSITGADGRSFAPDDAWRRADDSFDPHERPLEYGLLVRLFRYTRPYARKRNWLITLVILRSKQIDTAQKIAKAIRRLAIVLTVLVFGLYALAVYLARGRRRETLRSVGIGFIAAGAVALVARGLAGTAIVDSLATDIVAQLKRRRGGGPELLAYRDGRRWVDLRSPDINDGGNLIHGNLQIHPQTGNPNNNSTCPPSGPPVAGQ